MPNNSKIYAPYNGQVLQLIFNESFEMPQRDGITIIQLQGILNNWKLEIRFINDFINGGMNVNSQVDGNSFKIICTNWLSDEWIWIKDPFLIESTDKKTKAYVKVRSLANINDEGRMVHVSIWNPNTK